MSCLSIVGRANLDSGILFYYDRRTGLQIPDSIIASKYKDCTIDYVNSFTDIIQICRVKDNFNIVLGDQKGLNEVRVEYNNADKTFTCDKYDPRKIIPAILENEDTKLYFMSRDHPYYNKTFVPSYGNEDVPVKPQITEVPYTKRDILMDKLYNFKMDVPKAQQEGLSNEYKKFLEYDKRMDEIKYDDIDECYQLQIDTDGKPIRVGGNPVTPKKRDSTEPLGDEQYESIWDSYYQKRIQEPDSDSGCDSDGCANDHGDKVHGDRLTADDIKEIKDIFGDETDDLDDKSTWSLSGKKSLRTIPTGWDQELNEFDNDVPRRRSGGYNPYLEGHRSFGDLHMRNPLYKLPRQFGVATEEEKKMANARYKAAQILGEMDLETAIRESIKIYGNGSTGMDIVTREDMSYLQHDDPIQPGLASDAIAIVKPPKLEEREDNL